MNRKAVIVMLSIVLANTAAAQDKPPENPEQPTYKMVMKVAPKDRLSTRWAFVVDTSHSITNFGVLGGILTGFTQATATPADELWFCAYAFNNKNCFSYRKWSLLPAQRDQHGNSTPEWARIVNWFYSNTGTMSYGGGSINGALRKKVKRLTVIIISDGGFTEGGAAIKKIIKDAQAWRVANGFGEALILTIGIENKTGPGYPKPSNEICQGWMRDIGVKGNGGYFYVYKERKRKNSSLTKKER